VKLIVVWCESDPAVALTVIVLVPTGVPEFPMPVPPPPPNALASAPQPVHSEPKHRMTSTRSIRIQSDFLRKAPAANTPSNPVKSNGRIEPLFCSEAWFTAIADEGAVVETVMVAPFDVVTNEHWAEAGSPAQE
jgi:hypothetical protein